MLATHVNTTTFLSDGYLVIMAFNSAIDRSDAAWGHIAHEDVYDTLGKDPEGNVDATGKINPSNWTFRRVANLKCWGA